jgi:large subunit ribosomal protein L21
MKTLVSISDKQFFVEAGDMINVPTQKANVGDTITFDKVLLTADGANTKLSPKVTVTAKVLEHFKDDKVLIFKKKRRKRYRRTKGHRQGLTKVEIVSVG